MLLKYADEYKSHYKFICFIKISSQDSIVQGLIDLADKMNIHNEEIPIRLEKLRNRLRELDGDYLIIFDGIDHPEAFEELQKYLPNNKKCTLLTSTMSEHASQKLNYQLVSLTPWTTAEAVKYLLTTTQSSEYNQAKILAKKLGCVPLALIHASSYIRNRNYNICKYVEKFDQYEKGLFEKIRHDLKKEEKTILITFQIILNEIENYHKCYIAKPVLALFSFLSQAPISLIIIKHWFKIFFKDHSQT